MMKSFRNVGNSWRGFEFRVYKKWVQKITNIRIQFGLFAGSEVFSVSDSFQLTQHDNEIFYCIKKEE